MEPVLEYHRPEPRPPRLLRIWDLVKPLVVGLPLVVLLGSGMGLLVYGLGMPSEIPAQAGAAYGDGISSYAWSRARYAQEERAMIMGWGAGLLTAGLTTAALYAIRLLRHTHPASGGAATADGRNRTFSELSS